jgi:cytochrome c oxidase assembly protein subunit 11
VNVLSTQESPGAASAVNNSQIDTSRFVTVELDGNARGPWRFRPTVSSVRVHPGELAHVVYEVVNKQSRVIHAQAIPSYAPQESASHFKKLECFCFKQQTLGPNEARQMPVTFYVDPGLPKSVTTITLSYTFFEVGFADKTASR